MEERSIRTDLVYGFLDAGKTGYIQDCVFHDFFHKRGSTLILCFEEGETPYDVEALRAFRTQVAVYEGGEDITAFCRAMVERYAPDRVFVEMNAMTQSLREKLPECLRITFSITLISGTTLALYMENLRQLLQNMVSVSDMVMFNRCGTRESLAPYSQLFRLMNRKAVYLWEAPQGYHEKAFDVFVPYELEQESIALSDSDYIPFVLDAAAHPQHYDGKRLTLTAQTEYSDRADGADVFLGRTVMTCCLADLQFLGVPADGIRQERFSGGSWIRLTGRGGIVKDRFGQEKLKLIAEEAEAVTPPKQQILTASAQT